MPPAHQLPATHDTPFTPLPVGQYNPGAPLHGTAAVAPATQYEPAGHDTGAAVAPVQSEPAPQGAVPPDAAVQ